MKSFREKDVVSNAWNAEVKDQEFIKNGKSNFILFFMLHLGKRMIQVIEKLEGLYYSYAKLSGGMNRVRGVFGIHSSIYA